MKTPDAADAARGYDEKETLVEENGAQANGTEGTPKRCADCGLEYFPSIRRGQSDDRIDRLFGLDVVSALNIIMDLLHASHDRPGASEGTFAVWNWLAGLRQMVGPEQDSAREWAKHIGELRAQLLEFCKVGARQESLETQLVVNGGQTPVIRTRRSLDLAKELATELYALDHIWKKPSKARRPSKHILGTLELKLHKVGFSEREIAIADFDGSLTNADSERAINVAVERVKKRLKAAEKHPGIEAESGRFSDAAPEPG